MLFRLARSFVVFCVKQFFSSVKRSGSPPVERGPVLLVANHPNYMFDSMVVMSTFRRDLWFLAKATLFHNPLMASLLRWLHVIPVYRRQDNPEDVDKNDQTFRAVISHLEKMRAVCIFPEGLSKTDRKLSPIKTGAARIALQAEDQASFQLGVKIQPLGITYTKGDLFRSSLTVTLGDALDLSSYQSEFHVDPRGAVRRLTSEIENALRAVTVEVETPSDQALVEKIAKLYASSGRDSDDRLRFELVVKNLKQAPQEAVSRREEIEQQIDRYLAEVSRGGFDFHESLELSYDPLFLLLISPLVFLGYLIHWLPYRLIGRFASRVTSYDVQIASLKLSVGILLLPCWYLFLSLTVTVLSGSLALGATAFLLCVFSGYYVNNYLQQIRVASALLPGSRKRYLSVLKSTRDRLIQQLEQYRTY